MSNEYDNNNIIADNTDSGSDNDSSYSRTIYNRYDSIPTAEHNKKDTVKGNNNSETSIAINIFRFKFTDDFTRELYKFSKIHQYDHRKDFKEAWNVWIEENKDLVEEESSRLTDLGYEGDILDKMFKSARYYFRKKSTEKKVPKDRRVYVGVQKDLLECMDEHIMRNINDKEYKPSTGFLEFCRQNVDTLKEEVNNLCNSGITNTLEIKEKIKKTYKNRYFMIINK